MEYVSRHPGSQKIEKSEMRQEGCCDHSGYMDVLGRLENSQLVVGLLSMEVSTRRWPEITPFTPNPQPTFCLFRVAQLSHFPVHNKFGYLSTTSHHTESAYNMAGAGERARFYMEQSVPELQELLRKEIFTKVSFPFQDT